MRGWLALLIVPLAAVAQTQASDGTYGSRDRTDEPKLALPEYPNPANYLPFEVSAVTPFTFFVDAKSISVAPNAIVRYTLIAKSSDGALNVSYESMRCTDGNFRVYAYGSVGNSWFEVRNPKWELIRTDRRNPQRAVLFNDYFCPLTGYIANAADAVRVLKSGGNPMGAPGSN